ncbi:hypothetical protein OG2516_18695 [Oceanicola granulosus HTCC2516]|uniref:Sulfotransferase family protein n=1 Tax=Oceanicola granulosus (strain ATCC BAA-861 / DSM 15982 / KCTC 12143 / HTCC2516) TaxID=314256 RepID=Q2CHB7_OCEGH|nr:hypothetical protein [Oceanicola granulosus]EAR52122.1 hypothetical protein OG2516_18695 [Oceanicola granulosus HTCC2516]
MRIVLHVGSNKTGSTAIQDTCASHRAELARFGLLYPDLGGKTHHSELLPAVLDDEEYRGNFGRTSAEGRTASIERAEQLWLALSEQVDAAVPEVLLLSSEFCFGMRPQSFERLIARLSPMASTIDVVVYLREPASHYLSSAQQILKYGGWVKDPREAQEYTLKLRKLHRLVPGEVTMRRFSRDELFRKDVSMDLLAQIFPKRTVREMTIAPATSNAALSAEAMSLLVKFNRSVWQDRRKAGNSVNQALLVAIEAEQKKNDYTRAELRPEIRDIIHRVHLADMTTLKSEFGLTFPTFRYDVPRVAGDDDEARLAALEVDDIVSLHADKEAQLQYAVMANLARRASKPDVAGMPQQPS